MRRHFVHGRVEWLLPWYRAFESRGTKVYWSVFCLLRSISPLLKTMNSSSLLEMVLLRERTELSSACVHFTEAGSLLSCLLWRHRVAWTQCCSRGFWPTCSSPAGLGRYPWSWTFSSWGMSSKVSLYQRENRALIFSYFPLELLDCFLPTVKMCNGSDGRFFPWIQTHTVIPFCSCTFDEGLCQDPNLSLVPYVSKSGVRWTHVQRNVNATPWGNLWTKCCMMQLLLGISLVTGSLAG